MSWLRAQPHDSRKSFHHASDHAVRQSGTDHRQWFGEKSGAHRLSLADVCRRLVAGVRLPRRAQPKNT